MKVLKVRIEKNFTRASLLWSQQAKTGAWLSNKRIIRGEKCVEDCGFASNSIAVRTCLCL